MAKKPEVYRFTVTKDYWFAGVLFAFFVRWCVAAYPYSGYKKPPMYGDYEAQRHWQEITLHTPVQQWYFNTSQNDLQYWGLDYPPLTAYHSYLMGFIADWIEPESVRLFASRGYESDSHKTFMRWTVFLSEVYFYVTAVMCICVDLQRVRAKGDKNVFKRTDISCIMFLLYPGLILIDHGHFQYNCVSLGLFLWSTFFVVCIENDSLASMLFVSALNYKQMELYHALPFFFYLLRKCFIGLPRNSRLKHLINNLNRLAIAVTASFIVLWYPYINTWDLIYQLLYRLFPLKRGVFEDKVSNVWCFLNVFVKLKNMYSNEQMAKICMISTIIAALPSCLDLFFRINKKKFILSLINVSLAFFLFSFQVHEKTILLVAIPVCLYFPEDPFMCMWFLILSNFSMLPLLIKDGLLIPFIATNLIFISVYSMCIRLVDQNAGLFTFLNANKVYKVVNPKSEGSMLLKLLSINFVISILSMVFLTIASVAVEPPQKYPDLFPLLISVYSCSQFILFFIYFNYQQFSLPKCLPDPTVVPPKPKSKFSKE